MACQHVVPPDEGQGTFLSLVWCQTLGYMDSCCVLARGSSIRVRNYKNHTLSNPWRAVRAGFFIVSEEDFNTQLHPSRVEPAASRHGVLSTNMTTETRTLVDALGQLKDSLQTFKTSWKPPKKWLETLKEKFYNNAEWLQIYALEF